MRCLESASRSTEAAAAKEEQADRDGCSDTATEVTRTRLRAVFGEPRNRWTVVERVTPGDAEHNHEKFEKEYSVQVLRACVVAGAAVEHAVEHMLLGLQLARCRGSG